MPMRNRQSRDAGHTLMELVVVLVLMTAAASLVAPVTVRAYSNFKLRLAGISITQLFQQAKSRAVFEGRTYFVFFSPSTGSGGELLLTREDGSSIHAFVLPADISLSARRDKGNGADRIDSQAFFPDGTSEELQLDLVNSSNSTLRLEVDPMTARTRMVRIAPEEQ
jgi:Tfp pilus assembly protein FimT